MPEGKSAPNLSINAEGQFSPGSMANKFIEVDITNLVKSWKNGHPNFGLMITGRHGTRTTSVYGFYSREHKDPSKRPTLIISN